MGIIGTIFIGLIVGLLARFLKPGDDSMGWIMTILLGIGGSLAWARPLPSKRRVNRRRRMKVLGKKGS